MSRLLPRRTLVIRACGVVALAFAAATCKDLTGPTGVATEGGTVTMAYLGPPVRDANGVIQLISGNRISPPIEVRLNGVVATRARYVFSVTDTSVLRVSANGDTVIAGGRGRDTITATLVGATIGGVFDTLAIQTRVRVPVAVRPERNLVTTNPVPTLRSFGETVTISAESHDVNGKRTRAAKKVRWYSANTAIFTVDSVGLALQDSTNTSVVTAVGNGSAVNLITVFDDVDTVRTPVSVQQVLAKYVIGVPRFGPGNVVDFKSLGDTATVAVSPRDALDNPLTAGAVPPPTPTFAIAPVGRVTVNTTTGFLTANFNTDPGTPVFVTATGGSITSSPLPVVVQQAATSISIIGKRVDTIPSIGSTKDLIAIVKDARGNDVQSGVTWTSRNTAIAQFRSSSSGDFALAIDTGTTRFVVSRDQVADSITVTVTNNPETVLLLPDTLFIRSINEVKRFTSLTVRNAKGDALVNIPITWTSADLTIVQANADSTMLAKAVGATNVTARTPNGKTATSRVVVTNAPAFLDILAANATLASVGDTLLNPAVDFRNGLGVAVPRSAASWSSSDVNVATVAVDPSGNVRIIAAATGNAYIRAVSPVDPLVRDSLFVTVTNAPASIVAAPSPAPTMTAIGSTITFTATVFNASGNPIPTAKLRWSVPTGGAFVSIDSVTGVATALANGSATVRATSSGITTDIPVTVAQAIAGTRSVITPGVASLVADGVSNTSITVQLKDANDNNIAYGGSSIVLTTSLGTLSPLPPTDNGNGRYTTTLTTGTTGGSASVTGTANGNAITNNGLVAFTAGPANKYIVTPNNFTPPAGGAVTVRAQLADANNNPITTSGTVVQFTSTNGGSFTPVNGQTTTDVAGVATITFTTSAAVSSHTITATTGGITGSSATITSVAGTATKYIVTPSTTSPAAGSAVQIFAQLADANNNLVAQAGQTAVWTHTGSGSFPGGATDNSITNSSGVATINFTTSTTSGQTATVTASTGGLTGTSATITTIAGAGSQLFLAQPPTASPQSGVSFPTQPTIQLLDAAGNTVNLANVNVSAFITAGGGTLAGITTVQTNASGLATFLDLMITGTVGPRTLTFIANGFAATSAGVTLIEGPPSAATTTITASPTSIPADNAAQSTIDVQVRDAAGNPLGAGGLTVNLSTTLGSLSTNPATHIGGGVYRATLTAQTTSGTATVTGTIVGTGAIADDAVVSLTTIGATHYSVTPASGTVVVGSSVLVTAQLLDALNNPVLQSGKAVVWNNPEAGGTFATTTSVTDASGQAQVSFTGVLAGTQTIVAVDNTGLTGNGTVTVNNPVPTLTSIAPISGARLATANVVFTGSGFITGVSSVNVGAGITVNSTIVNSTTQITANITIAAAAATGPRTFSVTNAGPGGGSSGTQSFTVNNPLPTLTGIAPATGDRLQTLDVVFTGTGFISGVSSVNLPAGITANTTTVDSPTQITANLTIGATTSTGALNVSVSNAGPVGGTSATQTFTVTNPVPTLTSLNPAAGVLGQTGLQVVLTGTNFVSGATVDMGPDIAVNSLTVDSPTQITVAVDIPATSALGGTNVTVTNSGPGGGTSGAQTFTINAPPAPTLASIAPAAGDRLQTLNVVFTGTGFVNGVTTLGVADVGSDITVNSVTVNSPTQVTANLTIAATAALGARPFTITNTPAGGTSGAQTFTISNPAPTITNVNPNPAGVGLFGGTVPTTIITGTGFIAGVTVVDFAASSATIGSYTVDSPTQITVTNIAYPFLGGAHTLQVTNPGRPTATVTVNQ